MNEPANQQKAIPEWAVAPGRVRLRRDEFQVLHLRIDDEEFHDVEARRVFPLSGKADYVSFIGDDGAEVAVVAHPRKLDRASRRCLEQALENMYYVARIRRVDAITEAMGVSQWKVLTDRGYAVFEVVNRQTHIRIMPEGRYLITDADGNRFEIEDLRALDGRSQALVSTEV
jgi:hypothetical protein